MLAEELTLLDWRGYLGVDVDALGDGTDAEEVAVRPQGMEGDVLAGLLEAHCRKRDARAHTQSASDASVSSTLERESAITQQAYS
jgi:hypothetical protein